jgi:hypothetical protein
LALAVDARLSCALIQIVLADETTKAARTPADERANEVLACATVLAGHHGALIEINATVLATQAARARIPYWNGTIRDIAGTAREARRAVALKATEGHAV